MKSDDLEIRRARVQRSVAKRRATRIIATHVPSSIARERLVDLLVELLDERSRSGGR